MGEYHVGSLDDLEDGKPIEATAGETDILLVREGEAVHAVAATCPHRGVPLSKGYVQDGRIVCAVHRAAFELSTGALVDPPACEDIARYPVRLDGRAIHVTVAEGAEPHPLPAMARKGDDARRFVIVGSGAAGWFAAETLRREGFAGRLSVVTDDRETPYDRTDLSKSYLGAENPSIRPLRDPGAIAAHDIEIVRGRATGLDPDARTLTLEGAEPLAYDALLLATGSEARTLDVPGADLEGIHTLRTAADAEGLRAALDGFGGKPCRVAIVGGGFIGLEAAASLSGREGMAVTVILNGDRPLASLFGDAFGERLLAEHREAGVAFETGRTVNGFDGEDGRVRAVLSEEGPPVEADIVIVGIGAAPRTGWLPFEREEDGGIAVDARLAVPGAPDVYAAGDIATVPTPWGAVRIEHWRFAQETGALAARNMLGGQGGYDGVPFFWSMQHPKGSYTYTGHAGDWDEAAGSVEGDTFALSYVEDGKVSAFLALGLDDAFTRAGVAMAGRGPIPKDEAPAG